MTTNSSSSSEQPPVPPRPSSLAPTSTQNQRGYGVPPYSSAYGSPYGAAPYSRYGSSMYGNGLSYGGYGGSMYGNSMYGGGGYGSYGGGYRPGMGMNGPMGMPNGEDPNSLTDAFSQSTQATFQIIESIVGAVGGMAQMLESTYMATQSSFFAMVSVADQFANLRTSLAQILGIYAILRWARTLLAKLTGRPPPADATSLTPSNFFAFTGETPPDRRVATLPPKASKKPLVIFLLAIFGLPYLMTKLIRSMTTATVNQQNSLQPANDLQGADGRLDVSKLEFCKVLYDYTPPSMQEGIDISVKKGDPVAVLSHTEPNGQPSDWWQCRTRQGKVGYLPGVYLEPLQRSSNLIAASSGPATAEPEEIESRANTITTLSDIEASSRNDSMVREAEQVIKKEMLARQAKKPVAMTS